MIYFGAALIIFAVIFCTIAWIFLYRAQKLHKGHDYAGKIFMVHDDDNEDYIFFEIENYAALINDNEVIVRVVRKENKSSNGK